MGRAPCCDKANVKKGPWSPEEDAKLKAYIEKYGTGGNWIALPRKIGLKRCGKSCRLRWLNYLRPNIKHGGFTEEEDNIICGLYISIGSRWSIIAAQLPGRTDNDIKNYWNTRLKKKLLGRRKPGNAKGRPGINLEANGPQDGTSFPSELGDSALERLHLHMQFQTLQNPISNFYNNPALWPKLHPFLQEKMIQSLQFLPQQTLGQNLNLECESISDSHLENEQDGDFYSPGMTSVQPALQHDSLKIHLGKIDDLESHVESGSYSDALYDDSGSLALGSLSSLSPCFDGSTTVNNYRSNIIGSNIDQFLAVRSSMMEFEDTVISRTGEIMRQEEQAHELDYFKVSNGSKDSMVWWSSNDCQIRPGQSTSWDTTSVIHHEGTIYI